MGVLGFAVYRVYPYMRPASLSADSERKHLFGSLSPKTTTVVFEFQGLPWVTTRSISVSDRARQGSIVKYHMQTEEKHKK
jgi:hypothetical protein